MTQQGAAETSPGAKAVQAAHEGRRQALEDATTERPMSDEELALLDSTGDGEEEEDDAPADPPPDVTGAPDWAVVPAALKMPPGGQVFYMRFPTMLTGRPDKGERQVICWGLTEADEKHALRRTRGEAMRSVDELSKQMIRAIDGKVVNWATPMAFTDFWNEIGAKCRSVLKNQYAKTHMLTANETADFFTNCIAARTAVP